MKTIHYILIALFAIVLLLESITLVSINNNQKEILSQPHEEEVVPDSVNVIATYYVVRDSMTIKKETFLIKRPPSWDKDSIAVFIDQNVSNRQPTDQLYYKYWGNFLQYESAKTMVE